MVAPLPSIVTVADLNKFAQGMVNELHDQFPGPPYRSAACKLAKGLGEPFRKLAELCGHVGDGPDNLPQDFNVPQHIIDEYLALKAEHYDPAFS